MPDLNDALKGGADLAAMLDKADKSDPLSDPEAPPPLVRPVADVYTLADFQADQRRRIVPLDSLPTWPGGPVNGHGIGVRMNQVIGGGLAPGMKVIISAPKAGAGKTSFVHQLTDGLALRCAEIVGSPTPMDPGIPLTPVVWVSEMPERSMTWRSLARWTGHPGNTYHLGRSFVDVMGPDRALEADRAWRDGEAALTTGLLAEARRRFIFILDVPGEGLTPSLVTGQLRRIKGWMEADTGRPVWPVLVLDPYQRHGEADLSEIDAQNILVEGLRLEANKHGWIYFATSDTNAAAARGTNPGGRGEGERSASGVRGSYKAIHVADLHFHLEGHDLSPRDAGEANAVAEAIGWPTSSESTRDDDPSPYAVIRCLTGKNRLGPDPAFLWRWWPAVHRWEVMPPSLGKEWEAKAEAVRRKLDPEAPPKTGGRRRQDDGPAKPPKAKRAPPPNDEEIPGLPRSARSAADA